MLNNYMINKNGVQGYAVLGAYHTSNRNNINYDQVVNLNGSVELSEDLDLDFLVGGNLQSRMHLVTCLNSYKFFRNKFFIIRIPK